MRVVFLMGLSSQECIIDKENKMKEITTKMREDRVRRQLKKEGYSLIKNRAWAHPELFQGEYMIGNLYNNILEAGYDGNGFSMSLEEVEEFANEDRIRLVV